MFTKNGTSRMERRFIGNSNTIVRSPDADLVAAWALRACFDLAVGVIFISINLFDDQKGECDKIAYIGTHYIR
jgi:hypothetical protein